MAKRFFYICGGLLCLVAAYQLGTESSDASIVDTTIAGGWIVGAATEGNYFSILTADGSIYTVTAGGFEFVRTIPISVGETAFFLGDDEGIVARNGDVWKSNGPEWINLGPPPGAISVQSDSWGSVKDRYR